ncbi:MAG: aryldialkylphosphatase [Dehalococcoidia bacterium]|nr:aryldialkylphosphatase [Dehalococcoidia bacterium]MQG16543.1 aryldialkylphosphatase [SAR202 cluster bacterium]|tara:strand:- start:2736 stop:3794 length:1059 start_codon:yes stop_codon:yes gene_type:complete
MNKKEFKGKINTVLGPILPKNLGATLTHEHLLTSLDCYFQTPDEASQRLLASEKLSFNNIGKMPGKWLHHSESMNLSDISNAIEEVMDWKLEGGGAVVDATSIGIGRDPIGLAKIARATGLNIIMGSGYYLPSSYAVNMDCVTQEDIKNEIVNDLIAGVDGTGVKSGIIGEIGCEYPLTKNIKKVLYAAVEAQKSTGAPILIHPGHSPHAPIEIVEFLLTNGAYSNNIIIGHLDARIVDYSILPELGNTGVFLELDTFGIEDTEFGGSHMASDIPSDYQRIEMVQFLIDNGYEDQILIAHDVCDQWRYKRFGGKNYGHILNSIVPRMRLHGISMQQVKKIIYDNPAHSLTFK